MQDAILREITLKTPKERVYQAITDPAQIIHWFPDAIEGSLEVGERAILTFAGHGKSQIYVVAAQPFEYFAYRWLPGSAGTTDADILSVPNTLVEFRIEESVEGTKVTLRESGFASLPAEVAEQSFGENTGGWEYMIDRLEKLLNQA